MATVEPDVKTVSSKLFNGIRISVPWTCVFTMAISGAYYLFSFERRLHDDNLARDSRIEAIMEAQKNFNWRVDRIDVSLDKLNDKLDNMPRQTAGRIR